MLVAPAVRSDAVPEDLNALLAIHHKAISRAIAIVCRRAHLKADDAEDLAQDTWLHLLKNNCKTIQLFGRRSAPETYFARVAFHLLVDTRRRLEGHWRPSAAARHLGPIARELEAMIDRDGFAPSQAVEILHAKRGAPCSDLEFLIDVLERRRRHRSRLPAGYALIATVSRSARVRLGAGAKRSTSELSAGLSNPEQRVLDAERRRSCKQTIQGIQAAWGLLTAQDRLTLAERFARPGQRTGGSHHELRRALCRFRDLLTSTGVQPNEAFFAIGDLGLSLKLEQVMDGRPAATETLEKATG
jgi:hypothetical protein